MRIAWKRQKRAKTCKSGWRWACVVLPSSGSPCSSARRCVLNWGASVKNRWGSWLRKSAFCRSAFSFPTASFAVPEWKKKPLFWVGASHRMPHGWPKATVDHSLPSFLLSSTPPSPFHLFSLLPLLVQSLSLSLYLPPFPTSSLFHLCGISPSNPSLLPLPLSLLPLSWDVCFWLPPMWVWFGSPLYPVWVRH